MENLHIKVHVQMVFLMMNAWCSKLLENKLNLNINLKSVNFVSLRYIIVPQCTVKKIKNQYISMEFNIRITLITRVIHSPNRKRYSAGSLSLHYEYPSKSSFLSFSFLRTDSSKRNIGWFFRYYTQENANISKTIH